MYKNSTGVITVIPQQICQGKIHYKFRVLRGIIHFLVFSQNAQTICILRNLKEMISVCIFAVVTIHLVLILSIEEEPPIMRQNVP